MLAVNDQREIRWQQLPHFHQQLQSRGPHGLVETEARLVSAHVIGCGFDHRFAPGASLTQQRTARQIAAAGSVTQHFRVEIQPGHKQRLTTGNRLGEYREKRHDPEVGDHQPAPVSAWSRPELTRRHSLWASPNRGRLST